LRTKNIQWREREYKHETTISLIIQTHGPVTQMIAIQVTAPDLTGYTIRKMTAVTLETNAFPGTRRRVIGVAPYHVRRAVVAEVHGDVFGTPGLGSVCSGSGVVLLGLLGGAGSGVGLGLGAVGCRFRRSRGAGCGLAVGIRDV
jgi:hypothetical protein